MVNINRALIVLGVLLFEFFLTLAAELDLIRGEGGVLGSIIFQLFLAILGVKICLRQKQFFCSPFFLFLFMVVFFSVFGEVVFIAREYLGVGWGGRPDEVSIFFRRFCLVSFILFILASGMKVEVLSLFSSDEIGRGVAFKFLTLLFLGYVGIFISTNGFSQVSLFSENPDAVRYENREVSNVAVGSVFLLVSTLSVVLLMVLREAGKITFLFGCFIFFISYIPLLLSASRLLMLLPFVYVAMMKIQYLSRLKAAFLWKVAALGIVVLLCAFVFGAYRTYGDDIDLKAVVRFLASDMFPEFSGTVRTRELVSDQDFVTPLSTVLSGLFPGKFFQLFGLDKFEYFQLVGQLVGDMWRSQYSIRLSLMGELYYTDLLGLLVFFIFLALFVFYLHCKIFYSITNYRYIYVMTGVLVSLSVPYGALFLVIAIQFFVFSLALFSVIRLGWRSLVMLSNSGREA